MVAQSELILNQIFLAPGVVQVQPVTWPSLGWQWEYGSAKGARQQINQGNIISLFT